MRTIITQSTGTEDVEEEPDAEQDHALGPLHEPALGVVAEALGAGPLVGDEHRERGRREGEDREVRAFADEVPGDAAEDDRVGDAVGDGVEERAARAGLAGAAGDRAVEQVDEAARDEAEHRPAQLAGPDEQRGDDRERRARRPSGGWR